MFAFFDFSTSQFFRFFALKTKPRLVRFSQYMLSAGGKAINCSVLIFIMQPAQIKKNFYCVDCESKDLVGIQRRYDDEMKRRAVRRVVPAIFKGMNFVVALDDDELSEKVQRAITAYKGGLKPQITKRVRCSFAVF
jgi:hypothetical protein